MDIYLNNKKIRLPKKNSIGTGGEAEVFMYKNLAVKIFHKNIITPEKIEKLKNFPINLPENVLTPKSLVTNKQGNIIGYAMNFIPKTEPINMLCNIRFRKTFPDNSALNILIDAYETILKIHNKNVIIGDLNDLNILFKKNKSIFIDSDSMQFDKYICGVATQMFLDPKLYGIDLTDNKHFTRETDYYSFAVMLFRSLLFVNPYGGIHKAYKTFLKRAESRVSVYNKDVVYPKSANHYDILPDDLNQYFYNMFENDYRSAIEMDMLQNLHWEKCTICGKKHLKAVCPCKITGTKPNISKTILINQNCEAVLVFKTNGNILYAKQDSPCGKLRFIYSEGKKIKRENGETILNGEPDNHIQFDIMGDSTLIAKEHDIVLIKNGNIQEQSKSEILMNKTVFGSNAKNYFRVVEGVLMNRNSIVANVLENQTYIKAGSTFGCGYYRIGSKRNFFTFPVSGSGIKDIDLPDISGKLIDIECVFSNNHVLLLLSTQEKDKRYNSMYLINDDNELIAYSKENSIDSEILSDIYNKALLGSKVITTTDKGILLLDTVNGNFIQKKLFTDTEPFVNTTSRIFPASDGIYVVSERDIKLLKLN